MARGDHYAETALDVVMNRGFLGSRANARLGAFARGYGVAYNEFTVNVELMLAHGRYVGIGTVGVQGLLSAREITKYHHNVFRGMGLPTSTFGGTPMTGYLNESTFTSWAWCRGCDPGSSL